MRWWAERVIRGLPSLTVEAPGVWHVCGTGGPLEIAPMSAAAPAHGCTTSCVGSACSRCAVLPGLLVAAIPLAGAAVSGLAKRPHSGLALIQRTWPRSSCSEEGDCGFNGTSLCQAAAVREETESLIMVR
jgi:hypothetical protein